MKKEFARRQLLASMGGLMALGTTPVRIPFAGAAESPEDLVPLEREGGDDPSFRISLAQWSLHRTLRGGELDNLDFAPFTRREFGLDAVEYVNSFFFDKATDFGYLAQMRKRAEDAGVRSLLIMCDGEGALADEDAGRRQKAIWNHYKWAVAAAYLGCHSIRVNAAGGGSFDDSQARAAESLATLADFASQYGISVIVENHGGLSSNGEWLSGVMKRVGRDDVGTLPDFGNFRLQGDEFYDRYKGVTELMPFAKAVSAKSHEFDADGNEVHTDYARMMGIVLAAGYRGYVGVEYEGGKHSEVDGIRLTRDLLRRVRSERTAK